MLIPLVLAAAEEGIRGGWCGRNPPGGVAIATCGSRGSNVRG
jgi:hypothetical protein